MGGTPSDPQNLARLRLGLGRSAEDGMIASGADPEERLDARY